MYLYQKIAEKIKDQIQAKNKNEKLTDERSLAIEFNVSRSTIRKALLQLKDEGQVTIKQGAGIYIKEQNLIQNVSSGYYSLTDDMREIGKQVETILLNTQLIEAKSEPSYQGSKDQKLVKIERVRIIDNVKSIYEINLLPASRFPSLEKIINNNESLYHLLHTLYQVNFTAGHEELSVISDNANAFEALDKPTVNCLVNIIRTVYEDNTLVEQSESFILPGAFKWQYSLDQNQFQTNNET